MSDPTRTHGPPPAGPPGPADETHDVPPAESADGTRTHAADRPTAGPGGPPAAPPGFVIVRELGSGGMGVVYEARQTRLNRPVALKMLHAGRGDAKDVVRFLTEAEAVAAVRHPHVVQVYEFGQDDGRPFLVLELLTGGTLADRLKAGPLDSRAAAELVAKLADAVRAVHELGIIHRDLKPSNVLFSGGEVVRPRGGEKTEGTTPPPHHPATPKITDFGLAKRDGGADLTRTQAVMGTPAYMAPEQAKGDTKFVGPAADVHALGVVLYECLTGKRPFDGDDSWAVLQKVMHADPVAPRVHAPGVPRDLELIALECLEKNPADRYPSAAALADDLQRFLAGKPVSVRPAGRVERLVKWGRRNPTVAALLAALVLVILAGNAASTWGFLRAESRGRDLAKANDDLNATLGDLTQSRNALAASTRAAEGARAEAEARKYLSDVALAHQLWKSNDLVGMRGVLGFCPPERRKWEWHYLDGLSRPERAVYETDALTLALAYSPDGKLLAYLTLDGTLTVRDLAAGTERTWPTPGELTARLGSLAFRPGGGEVAYAAHGRVRAIDLATGKLRELNDPKHPPGAAGRSGSPSVAVGYAAGGQLLAAAHTSGDKPRSRAFVIRDAETAKPITTIAGYEEPEGIFVELVAAAFSPDGTRFAASMVDSGVRRGPPRKVGKNESRPEEVKFVPFNPVVKVWDAATGKQLWTGEGGGTMLGGLAFAADGSVGFGRGRVVVQTRGESGHRATNPGHAGNVLAVAFGPDGLVWSGGEDKLVRAFPNAPPTGDEQIVVLRGCERGVVRLAVSPDGTEVAAATGELLGGRGAVHRFDAAAPGAGVWRSSRVGRHQASLVTALSPDGARFAACDFALDREGPDAGRFVIRDTAGGAEREVKPLGLGVRGSFRPDGGLVVVAVNNRVAVVNPDGTPGAEFAPPAGQDPSSPPVVACGPDGRTAAYVAAVRPPRPANSQAPRPAPTARLTVLDAATLRPGVTAEAEVIRLFPAEGETLLFPAGAAIDPSGTRVAAVFVAGWRLPDRAQINFRGFLVVWDLTTGKELFRKNTHEPLYAVAFGPRGEVVTAGGTTYGIVGGWDVSTGEVGVSLSGHTGPVLALAFGPDGRLATGGADRTVKVWDAASGREVLTLDGFAREVTHVAFTPDGKSLVAATGMELMSMVGGRGLPTDWPPAEVRVFRGPK